VCHVSHNHWSDLQPYNYKFDCSQWYLRVTNWRINTYENSVFHFEKELLIPKQECFREISGFYHRIVEVLALPGFYAALVGISLLAFRDIISIPPSWSQAVQEFGLLDSKNLDCLTPLPLKMGSIGCTETSFNTYQTTLRKTQKSVELKHDFNIWRRSVQHVYHIKKSSNRRGRTLGSHPLNQYYKPASAHDKESYRVLEIRYKLPVMKIKL